MCSVGCESRSSRSCGCSTSAGGSIRRVGDQGESPRTVRDKVETARALESLPEIAAVAYEGALSAEQLRAVTKLADEASDAEWARRAPNVAPVELARLARNAVKPSTEDSRARYEARSLRMWWTPDKGMLHLHGQLPDVLGATFEATIQQLTEQRKPAKGQAWDSFEHRAADALVSCVSSPRWRTRRRRWHPGRWCRRWSRVRARRRSPGSRSPTPLLEQLRANATIEPVLVDDDGTPIAIGKRFRALSPKIVRAVLLRDHALSGLRPPPPPPDPSPPTPLLGRHRRHLRPRRGVHHLPPRPRPPRPLRPRRQPQPARRPPTVHLDDLTPEQRQQIGLPPRRAGPHAA